MICLLPTPSLWPYPAALHHRELMTPSIARSGTAAVPPEEREAIAALLCRAVRFPNREAATPGPRPCRGVAQPLVIRVTGRLRTAPCAKPMKHLVPDEANSPPDCPAFPVPLARLWLSGASLRASLVARVN